MVLDVLLERRRRRQNLAREKKKSQNETNASAKSHQRHYCRCTNNRSFFKFWLLFLALAKCIEPESSDEKRASTRQALLLRSIETLGRQSLTAASYFSHIITSIRLPHKSLLLFNTIFFYLLKPSFAAHVTGFQTIHPFSSILTSLCEIKIYIFYCGQCRRLAQLRQMRPERRAYHLLNASIYFTIRCDERQRPESSKLRHYIWRIKFNIEIISIWTRTNFSVYLTADFLFVN